MEKQKMNFNSLLDSCLQINHQLHSLNMPVDVQFNFFMSCTDISQVKQFRLDLKDTLLKELCQRLITILEEMYRTPFYELFIIDNVNVITKTFHVNIIDEIKQDLHHFPDFAKQFDQSQHCGRMESLFATLKEMPINANLYDTMISFCVKCHLPQNAESRLQFEMLIRDFENMGIISLTSKRDFVQKNLVYFT